MANILDNITVGNVDIIVVDANPSAGVTSPIGTLAIVNDGSGIYLHTTSTITDWYKLPTLNSSGALIATNGGTGLTSYTVGDILVANTTTTLTQLSDISTGNALISGGSGVAPSWGKIGLTTHISGTLGVTNGGTGLNSATTGGMIYASGTNTYSALAIGTTGQILSIAGGIPSWVSYGGTNTLLYTTAASTLASITTANNSVLITGGTGIPSLSSTIPSAVQANITGLGTVTSGTLSTGSVIAGVTITLGSDASYDTYYRNSSGVLTRLANGTTGQVLSATTSAAPSWISVGVFPYKAETSTYSISAATDYTIDCTSGSFTVTLPTAVGITGQIFVIKKSSNGTTITLATTSSQTIDGSTTQLLSPGSKGSLTVQSNGVNWIII